MESFVTRLLDFTPSLDTPFNEAVRRIGILSVAEFKEVKHWIDVFPYPNFKSQLQPSFFNGQGITGKSEREQRLEWEIEASKFFQRCKDQVAFQNGRLSWLFQQCLDQWDKAGCGITATKEQILDHWHRQNPISLAEFCKSFFTLKQLSPSFVAFAQAWRTERGLSKTPPQETIYIVPQARPVLIVTLKSYIEPEQVSILEALINENVEPNSPIVCNCTQVTIGRIFYELVKADQRKDRLIQSDKTHLARWICRHFIRSDKGNPKKFTELVILNYLKNKGFAEEK